MTRARMFIAGLLAGSLLAAVVHGQSRQDQQVLEDLRMLQEQVQLLRSAVAALAEQVKAANAHLDAQAETTRTNYANDSQTLKSLQTDVTALGQKTDVYAQQVGRFGAEIPNIRKGLEQQQDQLNKIQSLIAVPVPTPSADTSTGAPAAPGAVLPPSPAAAFLQAKDFWARGTYDLAIKSLQDFIQQFPDATWYLGEANYLLGMSEYNSGDYTAAATAFQHVIDDYKTSDKIADAYYQQGECYRALGRKTEAGAAYDQVIKQFPDSPAALQAKQAKIRLGIK